MAVGVIFDELCVFSGEKTLKIKNGKNLKKFKKHLDK